MLKNGYIKIHRSLLDWEWYDDVNTTRVFLHLILTANYEDKQWQDETIKRGSRVASYQTLSHETQLSIQQVRTAINHLELTGELTRCAKAKYTVFTINNYDKFQEVTRKSTKNQHSNNTQSTQNSTSNPTDNQQQCKNIKNIKNLRNKEESPVRQEPPGLMAARGLHINEGGDF